MDNYTTTEDHYQFFIQVADMYLTLFGFHDWRVEFYHGTELGDSAAECESFCQARYAEIKLAKELSKEPTTEYIAFLARHEVYELLLSPLRDLLFNTELLPSQKHGLAAQESHAIIRRLENIYTDTHDKLIIDLLDNNKKSGKWPFNEFKIVSLEEGEPLSCKFQSS